MCAQWMPLAEAGISSNAGEDETSGSAKTGEDNRPDVVSAPPIPVQPSSCRNRLRDPDLNISVRLFTCPVPFQSLTGLQTAGTAHEKMPALSSVSLSRSFRGGLALQSHFLVRFRFVSGPGI